MRPVRTVFDKLETQIGNVTGLEDVLIDPVRTSDVKAAIGSTKPSARQLASQYAKWQQEYESV